MAAECPRLSEFAELVPDHRLGDKHRDVLASVVHGDRVPEHVGDDHRAAGPGLDDVLGALFVFPGYLYKEVLVNERTFSGCVACVQAPIACSCQYDGDEQ
jgi:hypothetical protein